MFRLIIKLIILIASLYVGWLAISHPNLIFIQIGETSLEMPLWLAGLFLLMAFLLFYLLLHTWHSGYDFLLHFKYNRQLKKQKQEQALTEKSIVAWIKGDFIRAEKLALKIKNPSLIHYLIAGNAAFQSKLFQKSHRYLTQAEILAPNENIAIGIASLFPLTPDMTTESWQALEDLQRSAPKHPWILQACQQHYIKEHNPEKLFPILKELQRQNSVDKKMMQEQLLICYRAKLKASLPTQAEMIWKNAPKYVLQDLQCILIYLEKCMHLPKQQSYALSLIRSVLKKEWHPDLFKWYLHYNLNPQTKHLSELNQWLTLHGEKPEILYALGHYCAQQKLWGKAKDYFSRTLHFPNQYHVLSEYVCLLDELNQPHQAFELYKNYLSRYPLTSL